MCSLVQIISLLALIKLELREMINQLELTEGLLAPFNNFRIIEALAQSGASPARLSEALSPKT